MRQSKKMRFLDKVVLYEELATWRANLSPDRAPLVATNGCFDILHAGHVFLLNQAQALGKTLLVGVTGDAGVRVLKGDNRPIIPEQERISMLCRLDAVAHVCLFPEVDAIGFLEKCRPDIYVKGGDYTIETINQAERRTLEAAGSVIRILPRMGNVSTTAILRGKASGANFPRKR